MNHPPRLAISLCLAAFCALLTGCESPHREKINERDTPAERRVALRGEATFFDGQLRAAATISRGRPIAFSERDEGSGEHGQRGGGGRGGHHRGGGGMEGSGYGGAGSGGGRQEDSGDGTPVLHMSASRLPPVTLRLRLENISKEPINVQIHDVKSELGNFAVRPERLLLAPVQAAEVDPMISELGVTSDEVPVTVVLRVGGKTETHELALKSVTPPPTLAGQK